MTTPVSGAAFINALNNTFGRHPLARASHPKGVCASGKFTPAASLNKLLASPLFDGRALPALVRFSVGSGNPNISDSARVVRGIAFTLTGGRERYDLIMLSEPVFFAATTASFLSFMAARIADPATGKPDPAKVAEHNSRYPDGVKQPALIAAHPPTRSFLTTAYFSNNAFCFIDASGKVTTARIAAEPVLGVQYLSEAEEKDALKSYLSADLAQRLEAGPVQFTLYALLPADGDSLVDSTAEWIGAERIVMGTLEIQAMAAAESCDTHTFMPLNLPKGIEPSEDPILAARPGAYAVSVTRRT
ncbi:catalase [Duganella sp. FT135W]|uniref:catalase n=1 Tax=Duganella flavida TaxID=2692175 RepID=A0A6L8K5I8_9BURK|nr:catalase [Duganella flavida]MYM22646.1 catalase [Duganella flavida]